VQRIEDLVCGHVARARQQEHGHFHPLGRGLHLVITQPGFDLFAKAQGGGLRSLAFTGKF
jgi:hypothetical protein